MADVMALVPDQKTGEAESRPLASSGFASYESPAQREALIQAIFFAPMERDEHESCGAQPTAIAA